MHDVNIHVYTFVCLHIFSRYMYDTRKSTYVCLCVCLRVYVFMSLSVCELRDVSLSICVCFQALPVQVTGSCYLMLKIWLQRCVCVCGFVCICGFWEEGTQYSFIHSFILAFLLSVCMSSFVKTLTHSCIPGESPLPPRWCHSESAGVADLMLSWGGLERWFLWKMDINMQQNQSMSFAGKCLCLWLKCKCMYIK